MTAPSPTDAPVDWIAYERRRDGKRGRTVRVLATTLVEARRAGAKALRLSNWGSVWAEVVREGSS